MFCCQLREEDAEYWHKLQQQRPWDWRARERALSIGNDCHSGSVFCLHHRVSPSPMAARRSRPLFFSYLLLFMLARLLLCYSRSWECFCVGQHREGDAASFSSTPGESTWLVTDGGPSDAAAWTAYQNLGWWNKEGGKKGKIWKRFSFLSRWIDDPSSNTLVANRNSNGGSFKV